MARQRLSIILHAHVQQQHERRDGIHTCTEGEETVHAVTQCGSTVYIRIGTGGSAFTCICVQNAFSLSGLQCMQSQWGYLVYISLREKAYFCASPLLLWRYFFNQLLHCVCTCTCMHYVFYKKCKG